MRNVVVSAVSVFIGNPLVLVVVNKYRTERVANHNNRDPIPSTDDPIDGGSFSLITYIRGCLILLAALGRHIVYNKLPRCTPRSSTAKSLSNGSFTLSPGLCLSFIPLRRWTTSRFRAYPFGNWCIPDLLRFSPREYQHRGPGTASPAVFDIHSRGALEGVRTTSDEENQFHKEISL